MGSWWLQLDHMQIICTLFQTDNLADTRCLLHLLRAGCFSKNSSEPYTRHVTKASVRDTTGCPPVFFLTKTRWLHFFAHVAYSDPRPPDHHRAISASLRPWSNRRRPRGRPHTTWLRGIDAADVQSANIGLHSAQKKANDHVLCDVTSMWQCSFRGMPLKKKKDAFPAAQPTVSKHWRQQFLLLAFLCSTLWVIDKKLTVETFTHWLPFEIFLNIEFKIEKSDVWWTGVTTLPTPS